MTDTNYTKEVIGKLLADQRRRVGLNQGDIAKALGYLNVNFISMIESGKSKIPINRLADLVDAYQMNPEFILLILRAEHTEYLDIITVLSKRVPRIFKAVIEDQDKELANIFQYCCYVPH